MSTKRIKATQLYRFPGIKSWELPADADSYERIKEQVCFAIQDTMAEDDSTLNAAIAAELA